MDHLQAIRVFVRVVETGGFGRAALSLNMPNTTASKWVKSLEAHLGVKLLERNTRRVSVTSDGAAYFERARQLLSELDDLEATIGRDQASPRGVLRVDVGGSTASCILIPQLSAFLARYPTMRIQLSVTDRTVDLVTENIDCAIRSTSDDPDVVAHSIGTAAWTTCASPAYLAKYGRPKHPREIVDRDMPVVGYFSASTGMTQPLAFRRGEETITLDRVRNDVLVSESNAHHAAALAGLGIVHTMDFMVRSSIGKKQLVPILAQWRPDPLEVYIAYPPSRRYSTKVRVFTDWAASLFASA